MKASMILLTIVGGSGVVAVSVSNGSEETISRKGKRVEAVKSRFDTKPQLHYRPADGTFGGPIQSRRGSTFTKGRHRHGVSWTLRKT